MSHCTVERVMGRSGLRGAPKSFLIEISRIEHGRFAENWGSTWLPHLS